MTLSSDDVPMHVENSADCFHPLRSGRSTSFFDEQFSGVDLSPRPGTPVKDYWQVERHRKNHCRGSPFSKIVE